MSSASLSLTIDHESHDPIYLQLQQQIERLIAENRLKIGEKLPSSRELASALGISRTSTLKAIDNLIAEGILISEIKKGVFVSKTQPQLFDRPNLAPTPSGSANRVTVGFNSGADIKAFPNRLWAKSMRNAWLNPMEGVLQGSYADGLPLLKEQIVEYLQQLRGLHCCAEQIVITAGNRDALTIISHALLNEAQNEVWLEDPCYPQVQSLFNWLGKTICPLSLDAQGAITPDVVSGLALLTPCRQYPLGIAMSSVRRQQWLNLLTKAQEEGRNFWLVEDDYDNEYVYQGRTAVPLMQQDSTESTFFVGSFSKVMFRGLRLGFIVCPLTQVSRLVKSQMQLGFAGALAVQPALADFMMTGRFATHIRKMRRNYLLKRDLLADKLTELTEYIEWQIPNGGMHFVVFLKPRYERLEAIVCDKFHQKNISISPLSKHYLTPNKRFGFLLGFSQPSQEILIQAVGLLANTLQESSLHR